MSRLARRDTEPRSPCVESSTAAECASACRSRCPGNNRRTIDIAFTRVRLAVYVDGCFWHGCPEHHVRPRANSDWWAWKIERNQARDRDTDRALRRSRLGGAADLGARVPEHAAERVEATYRSRLPFD